MILIYGTYALVTNIIASVKNSSSYIPQDLLSISLGAKQRDKTTLNEVFYFVQAVLGVIMLFIWSISIIIMKYLEKSEEIRVE